MASRASSKRGLTRAPGPTGVQLGEASARGMILHGGAMVLAEHGVRAASVEQILRASGVSRRTFYRLYQSKEGVMVALYRIGTDGLLEACRTAIAEEADPLRRILRCIDAHLRSASHFGRLVYVLGGEAQHQDSLLYARRMEVHEALLTMFADATRPKFGEIDRLLLRALILSIEGVTRLVLEEGDEGRSVSEESIERARVVMGRIATATLAGKGRGVTPLPLG